MVIPIVSACGSEEALVDFAFPLYQCLCVSNVFVLQRTQRVCSSGQKKLLKNCIAIECVESRQFANCQRGDSNMRVVFCCRSCAVVDARPTDLSVLKQHCFVERNYGI